MDREFIPFNRPHMTGDELGFITEAHKNAHLSGGGPFTKKCQEWLEGRTGCHRALLAHSCTAALEMAAILAGIGPGDEVIMPSYTFVSTANAFVLRGGVPVFVDIRPDTLNLDERLIEGAITPRTRAVVPVHYAGVGCDMDSVMDVAARHKLTVIEDAAQGIMSTRGGRALGAIGDMGCLSFHETKNIISGEGGALLVNRADLAERAEIVWEKGTNRRKFFRGEIDKYTWVDIGSSFLPGELTAAFLWAQMLKAGEITARRLDVWAKYHSAFADSESSGVVRRPFIPAHCTHNAHMYYLLLPDNARRNKFIARCKDAGIGAIFHYIPLHSADAGLKFGRAHGELPVTDDLAGRIVRFPLWVGVEPHLEYIVDTSIKILKSI